ncbi:MAG: hypothetical protein U0270_41590 [Labilithrix sp.]
MNVERSHALRRFSAAVGALALVACVQKKVSPPEEEETVAAATEPADGGAEKTADDEADPGPKEDKAKNGPSCGVSFAKRVLPAFDAAGCAAIQCHGTRLARGIRIEVEDPALTYESLTTFAIGGKPYVKAGALAPEDSSIHCHLTGKCGVKMPPLGGVVPNALVTAVDTWLACGAPNN